jgi:23S rRNA pseudouridine1911/1915/1917 synthase
LLEWVLRKFPDTPRTRAKQWILAGRVSVNGVPIRKPHHRLTDPGAGLSLLDRHAGTMDCGDGWQIHPRVTLLYLDTSLAVLNKGPGVLAVPAASRPLSALSILADFICGKLRPADRNLAGKSLPPEYRRLEPLPVHRLDEYTSGVFCVAMNPGSREKLIEQLDARAMTRKYVAFVQGRLPVAKGTWRDWFQLSPDGMTQRVVAAPRAGSTPSPAEIAEAVTHFEVVKEYGLRDGKSFVSKLRLQLETGLKHQIRLQASHAGLPLIGDRTYNPDYEPGTRLPPPVDFPRQALHAEILSLEHPAQAGKRMSWSAILPKDLTQLEMALRRR